jgi:peptidyl-prolyl cis-trans isomerase SDCCAG10
MSTVYATEPATSGRVILETTHGPMEMELWCRECPTTTRLFLQLCQDGYYDNIIFHRILPSTLIQCGANDKRRPATTATATTGAVTAASSASIMSKKSKDAAWRAYRRDILQAGQAWKRQRYEVSSRLRFNHRGQVAMALPLQEGAGNSTAGDDENDNNNDDDDEEEVASLQPQFFITLEEAPYLDGKHVLFGTVTGPTIFNALRIGRTDVDEMTHEPAVLGGDNTNWDEAPRILRVKIVDNPIHQDAIVATSSSKVPWKVDTVEEEDETKKMKKRKRKGKLDVNVLSFGDELEGETATTAASSRKGMQSSHEVLLDRSSTSDAKQQKKRKLTSGDSDSEQEEANGTSSNAARMDNDEAVPKVEDSKLPPTFTPSASHGTSREEKAVVVAAMPSQAPPADVPTKKNPKVSALQAARAKFLAQRKNKNTNKQERGDYTLSKLSAFQDKVRDQIKARNNKSNNDDMTGDTSLAARMARRAQLEDSSSNAAAAATAAETAADQAETYHGQVLETTDADVRDGSWLATRFKCRQHMDLTAGGADNSNVELLVVGGDGRSADDYQVVDEQQARRSTKSIRDAADNRSTGDSRGARDNNDGRRHGHHHHHHHHRRHHHRQGDDDGGRHRHAKR